MRFKVLSLAFLTILTLIPACGKNDSNSSPSNPKVSTPAPNQGNGNCYCDECGCYILYSDNSYMDVDSCDAAPQQQSLQQSYPQQQAPQTYYPQQQNPQQNYYPRQQYPQQNYYPQQQYPQNYYPQQQRYPQQQYPNQGYYPQQGYGYPQQQGYYPRTY